MFFILTNTFFAPINDYVAFNFNFNVKRNIRRNKNLLPTFATGAVPRTACVQKLCTHEKAYYTYKISVLKSYIIS